MVQKQLSVWRFIEKNLVEERPVMLLYVLESRGSSPGRRGFCMAINDRHEMQGSIGGGMMEHKLIELAKKRLSDREEFSVLKPQVHKKEATENRSGMICSGEQYVYLHLFATDECALVAEIVSSIEKEVEGALRIVPGKISFFSDPVRLHTSFEYTSERAFNYTEVFRPSAKVHVIGGGHCSLALSRLLDMLGFDVIVYDDREDLQTMNENIFARDKKVLNSYEDLRTSAPINNTDYVVIMTFGYRTDKIALKAIRARPVKYLGLLGSKKKIDDLFDELSNEGFTKEDLLKIHAPVGLEIYSKTPEEIAVSIAAQIILERNKPARD